MKLILILIHVASFICRGWTFCPPTINASTPSQLVQMLDNCTYPTDKFTSGCVSSSCPQLKSSGLCPYLSNGSFNSTALKQILAIASQSFQQKGTICSTQIHPIPIPAFSVDLQNILAPLPISGRAYILPNNASLNDLAKTTFTLAPQSSNNQLIIAINNPQFNYSGIANFELMFGSYMPFSFHNIPISLNLSTSILSQVFLNTSPPSFKIQTVDLEPAFHLVEMEVDFLDIEKYFENALKLVIQSSDMPTSSANFLTTYITYALQVTTQNCPKIKQIS